MPRSVAFLVAGAEGHNPPSTDANTDAFGGAATVRLAPGVVVPSAVLRFSYSRADGPGGQNVNKRSTRAQLRVALIDLPMDERAKLRLRRSAGSLLVGDGDLLLASADSRSQRTNARACVEKLRALIRAALVEPKVRKPTKPSRAASARRLDAKKRQGEIKRLRRRPEP